jgi:hypothetical protein
MGTASLEGARLMKLLGFLFAILATASAVFAAGDAQRLIVVVGAAGSEEFEQPFRTWAERWQVAAKKGNAECTLLGLAEPGAKSDKELLTEALQKQKDSKDARAPVWLVLIGHGTYDGKTPRFNLRGPDISAAELKELLQPIESPLAMINCAASSGPFLADLTAPNRVVITATKSGHEYNFAHFGDYLSAAIADSAADLDKDDQTSLLEAYLLACSRLREYYAKEGRLATEHALLDDNGDKLGTPAEFFQGLRVVKSAKAGAAVDGGLTRQFILVRSSREERLPAEIRAQRDDLERQLLELRERKSKLPEAEYFALLEPLLVQIAKLSDQHGKPSSPAAKDQ